MEDTTPISPAAAGENRSVWLRIWQFPLIAMAVALALVVGAAYLAALAGQHLVYPALGETAGGIASVFVLIALCMLAYKLIIRRLGAKKHDDLPLNLRAVRDVTAGFGGGAILISICVGLAALFGAYRIAGSDDFADWMTIIFLFGLYAGFFEELLIRGIILRWLEELTGTWIALVISALIFGFLHGGNDNATFFSSLAIAIEAGVLLGAAYVLTRSLWLAIGLHAGWNVVQALWDVPVSGNATSGPIAATLEGPMLLAGGGFGLEATIFALVVATGAGIWMLVLASRRGRIVKPMWSRKGEAITAY
ncbi:CPBP family intramembrane glutamic endopeptidase [Aurantiacibacter rhizosphaerae]|uniref:CPBP family intramembrane metalloprotease n=1 Tax=Aurantiacibacter rhizosphaerae TaxID=2691582 RepID=A0A844XIA4_9SPHN|nr:type II CAAX endopeptidase family protein [Aurantiacibacter rhizosphaerae]MWV29442.1 CPBP family intramembrane metalloprotease [Aurantiacibacter rhizosphaerae]